MPLFLAPSQLKAFISKDLIEGPLQPIDYIDGTRIVRGYDAQILPAICNVWLKAREAGALGRSRSPKAGTGVLSYVDELPFFCERQP